MMKKTSSGIFFYACGLLEKDLDGRGCSGTGSQSAPPTLDATGAAEIGDLMFDGVDFFLH